MSSIRACPNCRQYLPGGSIVSFSRSLSFPLALSLSLSHTYATCRSPGIASTVNIAPNFVRRVKKNRSFRDRSSLQGSQNSTLTCPLRWVYPRIHTHTTLSAVTGTSIAVVRKRPATRKGSSRSRLLYTHTTSASQRVSGDTDNAKSPEFKTEFSSLRFPSTGTSHYTREFSHRTLSSLGIKRQQKNIDSLSLLRHIQAQ